MKLIFCMQVSMKACYKLIVCRWSRIPKVSKIASLQCLYSISKKNVKLKFTFSLQSFQKVYFNILSTKVAYKVDIIITNGHDQVFSNYLKKFAISLQYLKKEIRNGNHFGMQINVKVSTVIFLQKLVIFLQYIRKNVATALCSIVMQKIQIFYRGPAMFIVTCFSQIDVMGIIEIQ